VRNRVQHKDTKGGADCQLQVLESGVNITYLSGNAGEGRD
jgi:hypothetical protein